MKINKLIIDTLKEANLEEKDYIPILIAYYFGYELPTYLPLCVSIALNKTGILTQDETGELVWKVPLFEGQETQWDWVHKEYQILFEYYDMHNKWKKECVTKMKKLFREYPEIRKSDVISATKNYLTQCISTGTQAKFVKRPQNFLWFGQGVSLEQMILSYIPEKEDQVENTHSSNVMR